MLNSKVEIPHPTTISHNIREIFSIFHVHVSKVLQVHFVQLPDLTVSLTPNFRHIQAACTCVSMDKPYLM